MIRIYFSTSARDLLMKDFEALETSQFPSKGGVQVTTDLSVKLSEIENGKGKTNWIKW